MKSPRRLSNRLSNFRFSLASIGPLRSPVSPLTPPPLPLSHNLQPQEPLPKYVTNPSTRSSTAPMMDSEPSNEKTSGLAVTVIESHTDDHIINQPLQTPTALPETSNNTKTTTLTHHHYHTPALSPLTPWHATFHRNAATTTQETAYLTRTTRLRHLRTTLTILLLLLSATTTALTSTTLHKYLITNLPTSFSLPLWPTDTNTTPTILALTTAVLTLLLTLPTTTLHIIPSPNPRTNLCITLFTITSCLSTLLGLATLITSAVQTPHPLFSAFISSLTPLVLVTGPHSTSGLSPNGSGTSPRPETIQSFTCSLVNTANAFTRDAHQLSLPYPESSAMVPAAFLRICRESQVGLVLVVLLCIVGGVGCVVGLWSWSVERGIKGARGERELASREGSENESEEGRIVKMPAFVEEGDLKGRY